jgi:hypothetical protein
MLLHKLFKQSFTGLDNQTDILRGVSTRIRTRPAIPASTAKAAGRPRTGTFSKVLAALPLAGIVAALAGTGWLPVVLLALVLLLPALVPVMLVALGVLATGAIGGQQG